MKRKNQSHCDVSGEGAAVAGSSARLAKALAAPTSCGMGEVIPFPDRRRPVIEAILVMIEEGESEEGMLRRVKRMYPKMRSKYDFYDALRAAAYVRPDLFEGRRTAGHGGEAA